MEASDWRISNSFRAFPSRRDEAQAFLNAVRIHECGEAVAVDFTAERLSLALLSVPTAESGMNKLRCFGRYDMGTGKMQSRENTARVHLRINGRVQGVYFRASTMEQARQLGIVGWVMNCPDGSVEVLAEGEKEQLEKLISWCRRGPPGAKVTEVLTEWEASKQAFHSFFVKR